MSIPSDLRTYADSALDQGRQVLDQAQSQLSDVTVQANDLVGKLSGTAKDNITELTSKATGAVHDLRLQAGKAVNVDVLKTAAEPYLTQARGYGTLVTDRAEELYSTVRDDKRVAKLVTTAESFTTIVVETVTRRVVKPVQALTRRCATAPASRAATASKPATSRPAARPAAKATARKAPAKKAAPTA